MVSLRTTNDKMRTVKEEGSPKNTEREIEIRIN